MISAEHLTKYYGNFLAVDDISFHIKEGQVYGFLGPNGAGKSTTMNIMTGCLSATSGHVRIDGHDIFEEPDEAKRQIGYLPEHPPLYLNDTPWNIFASWARPRACAVRSWTGRWARSSGKPASPGYEIAAYPTCPRATGSVWALHRRCWATPSGTPGVGEYKKRRSRQLRPRSTRCMKKSECS